MVAIEFNIGIKTKKKNADSFYDIIWQPKPLRSSDQPHAY